MVRGWSPRERRLIAALVFCIALYIFTCVKAALADNYRVPLPAMSAIGWTLYAQSFDATNGALVGAARKIGHYRTAGQCSKAQRGRISRAHAVGPRWLATTWVCSHIDLQKGSGVL